MRLSRRWLFLVGAVLAAAVLLWPRSDDRSVRRVLDAAAAALGSKSEEDAPVRAGRLARELAPLVASDVRVDVPGAFVGEARDRALAAATDLARGRRPVIELRQVEIGYSGANRATARFDVIASGSQAGDLHASPRHARAELEKRDGKWQITLLSVEPEARAEPEPRP